MNKFFFSLILCTSLFYGQNLKASTLQYCIPVEEINFNPFREIKDGKELAYLLLLKPYISTKTEDLPLIEAYEFSPDGKVFTARLSANAKWADGTPVSAQEAALGIAKGFLYRPIGERVHVLGGEKLLKENSASGIKIINSKTFEITFDSTIENLTGAIREALTAGSRHNRVWPVRSHTKKQIEYLFKNKSTVSEFNPQTLEMKGHQIEFASSSKCKTADFTIYPEIITTDINQYVGKKNKNAQAITLQLNTKELDLKTRKALATWIRNAFSQLPPNSGIVEVPSFFLEGEPGYTVHKYWSSTSDIQRLKKMNLKIGIEIPSFKSILEKAATAEGLQITFYDFPLKESSIHGQVLSSGIHNGRQIILQDILKWNMASTFLKGASKTKKSLEVIAERSASTIPPDVSTLQNFEKVAAQEYSIIPLGRRYVTAYSKKVSGIYLSWSPSGELIFE